MKRLMMFAIAALLIGGVGFTNPRSMDDDTRQLPALPGVEALPSVEIVWLAKCTMLIRGTGAVYGGCPRLLSTCLEGGGCFAAIVPGDGIIGVCVPANDSTCTGRRVTLTATKFAEGKCTTSCECIDLKPVRPESTKFLQ
ncbi:hypothetical protein [Fischerella thermalis]|uniref:Uncharacterized protein n=1 Tax=Fischerella thermalis CCMEE 5318 TaxID=2019666 RepID=A0A2N6L4K0_9CYAN|nr:hypothetical protein [Fischerella thermalis]PMB15465.1 hypothetical protein CEN46_25795 [Fischerella thermalis CCMEE 5318]